jgi:hypothetical protein
VDSDSSCLDGLHGLPDFQAVLMAPPEAWVIVAGAGTAMMYFMFIRPARQVYLRAKKK